MILFERVRLVSEKMAGSQANLARELGIHVRTFQNYLKKERQDNLWPLLGQIEQLYPALRREWLWWGEGEMLFTDSAPAVASQQPAVQSAEVTRLLSELEEERRLNRQLVTRLLVDGEGDKGGSKNTAGKVAGGQ